MVEPEQEVAKSQSPAQQPAIVSWIVKFKPLAQLMGLAARLVSRSHTRCHYNVPDAPSIEYPMKPSPFAGTVRPKMQSTSSKSAITCLAAAMASL